MVLFRLDQVGHASLEPGGSCLTRTRWAMPHSNLDVAIPWGLRRACVVLFRFDQVGHASLEPGGSCLTRTRWAMLHSNLDVAIPWG